MAPLGGWEALAPEADCEPHQPIGVARLAQLAFTGADLKPLWQRLVDRYVAGDQEPASLMDLATLEQLFGNVDGGLAFQRAALEHRRLYRSPAAMQMPALRLLALAAPGDIGANTPLEFLLQGSDIALETLYIVPGSAPPETLPPFDIAIVAAGESDANRPVHAEIARLTSSWRVPVLNDPQRVALLSREGVASMMQGVPELVAPMVRRVDRRALERLDASNFPIIARPLDSHAGHGLARIETSEALASYLAGRTEGSFYVAPFVDYRGADGLYRKYRIAFIDRAPYACHMAIADQWMIYYLNAGMRESAAKRAEEARFMAEFDTGFAERHRAALAAVAARLGLDYVAIDCAEMPDGRLLLFEADIAMIVHAMDPPDLFPYKAPQMRKVFDAFRAMLKRRAAAP